MTEIAIASAITVLLIGLGFLMGMTYAESNLGGRVKDKRREEGRKWWQ